MCVPAPRAVEVLPPSFVLVQQRAPATEPDVSSMTPEQHRALDQAAAWIARLRADDVGDADRARFACWLKEQTGNAEAFERMLEIWKDLGVLRAREGRT